MPSYDKHIQESIIVATMVLHFVRIQDSNDIGTGFSKCDINENSEGGYCDEMTYVISSLDESKMKVIRNKITTSICGDDSIVGLLSLLLLWLPLILWYFLVTLVDYRFFDR